MPSPGRVGWGPVGPVLPFTMAQIHREGPCTAQGLWCPQGFGLRSLMDATADRDVPDVKVPMFQEKHSGGGGGAQGSRMGAVLGNGSHANPQAAAQSPPSPPAGPHLQAHPGTGQPQEAACGSVVGSPPVWARGGLILASLGVPVQREEHPGCWGCSGSSRKAGPTSDAHIPSQAQLGRDR